MHWGLLILSLSAGAERSFNLFLPALAQSRGGLFLAYTRSKSRRTFSCLHSLKVEEDFFSFSPALAQRRGGLFSFSPALAQRRGGLFLFLPQDARERLRSLIITGASDRRKTMRTFWRHCRVNILILEYKFLNIVNILIVFCFYFSLFYFIFICRFVLNFFFEFFFASYPYVNPWVSSLLWY